MPNQLPLPKEFVVDLYAAALDGRGLATVLTPLAEQIGCSAHAVHFMHCEGGTVQACRSESGTGEPSELMDEYALHWARRDPWAQAAAQAGEGVVNMARLVPPAVLRRSAIWNEWGRPRDAAFHCLSVLARVPGETVGSLAFHRSVRDEPFGFQEERLLQTLEPHLHRALLAQTRLVAGGWDSVRAMRAGLMAMKQGVALLDRHRRLALANPALERMVEENDGLALAQQGGITSHDPVARQALARGIGAALGALKGEVGLLPDFGTLVLPRRSRGTPWLVQVVPVPTPPQRSTTEDFSGVMLLVTDDQARPKLKVPVLCQAYGLTPAEGSLAAALAAGRTLAQHAVARRISIDTARRQLGAIRRKTGCRRLADLTALLARLGC